MWSVHLWLEIITNAYMILECVVCVVHMLLQMDYLLKRTPMSLVYNLVPWGIGIKHSFNDYSQGI